MSREISVVKPIMVKQQTRQYLPKALTHGCFRDNFKRFIGRVCRNDLSLGIENFKYRQGTLRARILVVSDLRSKTKGSSSSLVASYV